MLPTGLGARVSALAETLVLDLAPAEARVARATLGTLASAVQIQRQVAISYRTDGGAATERAIGPYGVVFHAGDWYTVGHCHLRGAVRVFRLDRIGAATLLEEGFTRPAGFDSKAHLLEAIARIPDIHEVSVLLTLDLAEAQRRCPPGLARFEPAPPYVRLRASVDDLGMLARVLAGLGCPLLISAPSHHRDAPALSTSQHTIAEAEREQAGSAAMLPRLTELLAICSSSQRRRPAGWPGCATRWSAAPSS